MLDTFRKRPIELISILVNNAGICTKKALETISMSDILRLYDINLFGYLRMMRAVLPIMKKQESGRIINMSSRNAIEGMFEQEAVMNGDTVSKVFPEEKIVKINLA